MFVVKGHGEARCVDGRSGTVENRDNGEKMFEKLLKRVTELAPDGRLSCPRALRLANEMGVPPIEVGRAANHLKVKIFGCQLGCFK